MTLHERAEQWLSRPPEQGAGRELVTDSLTALLADVRREALEEAIAEMKFLLMASPNNPNWAKDLCIAEQSIRALVKTEQ